MSNADDVEFDANPNGARIIDFVIYKDTGIESTSEVLYSTFDEPFFETPEEAYEYVTTHECEFYPSKCKERWRWRCPNCGVAAYECGGNCAIVKLNHYEEQKDGGKYHWFCDKCSDEYWEEEFNET